MIFKTNKFHMNSVFAVTSVVEFEMKTINKASEQDE